MARLCPQNYYRGFVPAGVLVASVFIGALAVFGFLVIPGSVVRSTDIRIEPLSQRIVADSEFAVDIVIESAIPVNAFEGHLRFSQDTLEVTHIAFDGSVADLWVEEPRYSNEQGTIDFIGGTTRPGGFVGEGILATITFKGKQVGEAALFIERAVALKHDGLGSDAPLEEPLSAAYIIERLEKSPDDNTVTRTSVAGTYAVSPTPPPSPDLNSDGRYTIADISIFMRNLAGYHERYDFNQDSHVNMGDLSILMQKMRE